MKKILVICGPTATGKTALALKLAKKFNGEIISADSRQVFKFLDIGTGKDLPFGSVFRLSDIRFDSNKIGYYSDGEIPIWGYDLVLPDNDFSVSHYARIVSVIVQDIYSRGKLPILVGGTGLYIKSVVDGIETTSVPKNKLLRSRLEQYNVDQLYTKLSEIDPIRSASLNMSDRKNPRRLIRAIEIADYKIKNGEMLRSQTSNFDSVLWIGLKDTLEKLAIKIKKRIKTRMEQGMLKEVENLQKKKLDWDKQALSALGYLYLKDYLDGKISWENACDKWLKDEIHYAKRQVTWFKRDNRINWFDCDDLKLQQKVETMVKKWYDQ